MKTSEDLRKISEENLKRIKAVRFDLAKKVAERIVEYAAIDGAAIGRGDNQYRLNLLDQDEKEAIDMIVDVLEREGGFKVKVDETYIYIKWM